MSNRVKTVRSYIMRGFWILVGATAFAYVTFAFWVSLNENAFVAYIVNVAIILFFSIIDKIRLDYLHKRKKAPFKNKRLSEFFDYFVLEKHSLHSIKSSLYVFYILVLVSSHLLLINPYLLDVSESVRSYLTTIGYGLIILVAVDKFIGQFMKDEKRIKTYEDKQKES